MKVFFRCNRCLQSVDFKSKAGYPLIWWGWASFSQLKALKEKTEDSWVRRNSASRLQHENSAWLPKLLACPVDFQTQDGNINSYLNCQPALWISHLPALTIVWANFLKYIFSLYRERQIAIQIEISPTGSVSLRINKVNGNILVVLGFFLIPFHCQKHILTCCSQVCHGWPCTCWAAPVWASLLWACTGGS